MINNIGNNGLFDFAINYNSDSDDDSMESNDFNEKKIGSRNVASSGYSAINKVKEATPIIFKVEKGVCLDAKLTQYIFSFIPSDSKDWSNIRLVSKDFYKHEAQRRPICYNFDSRDFKERKEFLEKEDARIFNTHLDEKRQIILKKNISSCDELNIFNSLLIDFISLKKRTVEVALQLKCLGYTETKKISFAEFSKLRRLAITEEIDNDRSNANLNLDLINTPELEFLKLVQLHDNEVKMNYSRVKKFEIGLASIGSDRVLEDMVSLEHVTIGQLVTNLNLEGFPLKYFKVNRICGLFEGCEQKVASLVLKKVKLETLDLTYILRNVHIDATDSKIKNVVIGDLKGIIDFTNSLVENLNVININSQFGRIIFPDNALLKSVDIGQFSISANFTGAPMENLKIGTVCENTDLVARNISTLKTIKIDDIYGTVDIAGSKVGDLIIGTVGLSGIVDMAGSKVRGLIIDTVSKCSKLILGGACIENFNVQCFDVEYHGDQEVNEKALMLKNVQIKNLHIETKIKKNLDLREAKIKSIKVGCINPGVELLLRNTTSLESIEIKKIDTGSIDLTGSAVKTVIVDGDLCGIINLQGSLVETVVIEGNITNRGELNLKDTKNLKVFEVKAIEKGGVVALAGSIFKL